MNIEISKKWLMFFGVCFGFTVGTIISGFFVELTIEEITKRCFFQIISVLCFCLIYDGE
jgi:hypothetical protein